MSATEPIQTRARTKIVSTIGPATRSPEMLEKLIKTGVDVFRVNSAHGTREEHQGTVDMIRAASKKIGRPVGILLDLAGPKIRLGQLAEDPVHCSVGDSFFIVPGEKATAPNELVSGYEALVDDVNVGNHVMLADGTIAMVVVEKQPSRVECRVLGGGTFRSRQGINLPDAKLSVGSLTESDLDNALWAAGAEIDFVGISFVRSAIEVRQIKNLLVENGSSAKVVAKIEKREAVEALEEIVAETDAVMVARGDLGVETDVAAIAVVQKQIIETCSHHRKPVIVATQMLDSMQNSPRPTRAEATDVANAILDGADACMLSGETAIGQYPLESVDMMNRIMLSTEQVLQGRPPVELDEIPIPHLDLTTQAVVEGAGRIADRIDAKLVVIVSQSGATALAKSKQRNFVQTAGISSSEQVLRHMSLMWGIVPVPGAPLDDPREMERYVEHWGLSNGELTQGDKVVFVTGSCLKSSPHTSVYVHIVE